MARWNKENIKLRQNHNWRGKPGYKIFVADKGAVRFNYPQTWVVEPASDCIKFFNVKPPHHKCILAVSYIRLPSGIDWSELPLRELVKSATDGKERNPLGEIVEANRPDIEIAWQDYSYLEPDEQREAWSRICLSRAENIQCLLTFDYFPEDAPQREAVWQEVMRSLELGRYISDPSMGDMIN